MNKKLFEIIVRELTILFFYCSFLLFIHILLRILFDFCTELLWIGIFLLNLLPVNPTIPLLSVFYVIVEYTLYAHLTRHHSIKMLLSLSNWIFHLFESTSDRFYLTIISFTWKYVFNCFQNFLFAYFSADYYLSLW